MRIACCPWNGSCWYRSKAFWLSRSSWLFNVGSGWFTKKNRNNDDDGKHFDAEQLHRKGKKLSSRIEDRTYFASWIEPNECMRECQHFSVVSHVRANRFMDLLKKKRANHQIHTTITGQIVVSVHLWLCLPLLPNTITFIRMIITYYISFSRQKSLNTTTVRTPNTH